jgi:hypothetical protein
MKVVCSGLLNKWVYRVSKPFYTFKIFVCLYVLNLQVSVLEIMKVTQESFITEPPVADVQDERKFITAA